MIKRHFQNYYFSYQLLFFYTIFKSEIYWEGKLRLLFQILFIFILILFLITFLLNDKIKEYLGIFF